MLIDCDTCAARGAACGECLLSAVIEAPSGGLELDHGELRALAVFARAGLLPELRVPPGGGARGREGPPEPIPLPGTGPVRRRAQPPRQAPPQPHRVRRVA
jgi:hypothetical protein